MKNWLAAAVLGVVSFGTAMQANADPLTPQDYLEIQQLYAKYNDTLDHGDAEGYASTFTADGSFNTNSGHDALVNFAKAWQEKMGGANRRHWNDNLRLSGDSKSVTATVYLMIVDIATKPASIIMTGSYADTIVKTADGWRFSKRATKRDTPQEKQA